MKLHITQENLDEFSFQMMQEITTLPALTITRDQTMQPLITLSIDAPINAQTLTVMLRDKTIKFSHIIKLFEAIDMLIESLKAYLISAEQLILNSTYIYYDISQKQWLFLVLPLKEMPIFIADTIDEQQRLLLKLLLCHESQPIPYTSNDFKAFVTDYSVLPTVWLKKLEMHTMASSSVHQPASRKKKIFQVLHSWLQKKNALKVGENLNNELARGNKQVKTAFPALKETIMLSKYPCFMCLKTHERYYLYYDHLYIGRGEQCHIRLFDEMISLKHASVLYTNSQHILKDENSKNGVYVEGERLSNVHILKNGDAIRLGNLDFIFIR